MAEPTSRYPVFCTYRACQARWDWQYLEQFHGGSLERLEAAHKLALRNPTYAKFHTIEVSYWAGPAQHSTKEGK
jgi:beta-galactosidase GanA